MDEFESPVECTKCHEVFDAATSLAPFRQYNGRVVLKQFCPHCGEWFVHEEE